MVLHWSPGTEWKGLARGFALSGRMTTSDTAAALGDRGTWATKVSSACQRVLSVGTTGTRATGAEEGPGDYWGFLG